MSEVHRTDLATHHPRVTNVQALAGNSSVKALDLSHNMIGDKETYNFVRPDYTTGGEAVAEMLEVRPDYPRCSQTPFSFQLKLCGRRLADPTAPPPQTAFAPAYVARVQEESSPRFSL